MSHIDNDNPPLDGVGQNLGHRIVLSSRRIPSTKGLQNQPSQPVQLQHRIHHLRLDAREDPQTRHVIRVEVGLDAEMLELGGPPDQIPGHLRPHGRGHRQRRTVRGIERGEVTRRDLGCAVPAEQLVVEVETDLRDHEVARHHERPEQVIRGIVLQLEHRGLGPRQDDGFAQVLQHEAERRAGVCQTVGAVQDDERVKERVVEGDGPGDLRPAFGVDRAAVEQLLELEHGVADLPVIRAGRSAQTGVFPALPGLVDNHLQGQGARPVVERRQPSQTVLLKASCGDESGGRPLHADGAARHDDEDVRLGDRAGELMRLRFHCHGDRL